MFKEHNPTQSQLRNKGLIQQHLKKKRKKYISEMRPALRHHVGMVRRHIIQVICMYSSVKIPTHFLLQLQNSPTSLVYFFITFTT